MPKIMNDDDLLRLTSEAMELAHRLTEMRERKIQDESALTDLDEAQSQMVRRINDITEHLNHATEEFRRLTHERTERIDELRYLSSAFKEAAKQWRTLRRTIQDSVGRDVCPQCGSTEILPILYGLVEVNSEIDEPFVGGGCTSNSEETVCCLDCGERFHGGFEKWERARTALSNTERD